MFLKYYFLLLIIGTALLRRRRRYCDHFVTMCAGVYVGMLAL